MRLIWIDQPIDYTRVASPSRVGLERMRAVLREELARLHVPLLEAHTRYDFAHFPLVDDVHFTDRGNQELARILAPQLLDVLGVH